MNSKLNKDQVRQLGRISQLNGATLLALERGTAAAQQVAYAHRLLAEHEAAEQQQQRLAAAIGNRDSMSHRDIPSGISKNCRLDMRGRYWSVRMNGRGHKRITSLVGIGSLDSMSQRVQLYGQHVCRITRDVIGKAWLCADGSIVASGDVAMYAAMAACNDRREHMPDGGEATPVTPYWGRLVRGDSNAVPPEVLRRQTRKKPLRVK